MATDTTPEPAWHERARALGWTRDASPVVPCACGGGYVGYARVERADRAEVELAESRNTITALREHLASSRERVDQLMKGEAKYIDVLRRVREFVSKILAEPTVERQVRAMIPEAFEPQGEGGDNG